MKTSEIIRHHLVRVFAVTSVQRWCANNIFQVQFVNQQQQLHRQKRDKYPTLAEHALIWYNHDNDPKRHDEWYIDNILNKVCIIMGYLFTSTINS